MTSITTNSSHGRFSRHGFTFGLKSQSESRERARNSQRGRDEDWYIPYTGPYEPPPEPRSSRTRDRDSWGDPIYADEAAGSGAPRVHYDDSSGDRGYSSRASEENRIRGRERARSVSSSCTVSGRPSDVSQRRNIMTSYPRQPALSYITPEVGGVGESPVPHLRQSKDRPASPRASLASIFTFGVRPPTSPVRADRAAKSPARKLPYRANAVSAGDSAVNRLSTNEHRRTMSGGTTSQSIGSKHPASDRMQSLYSQTTTDEEYYNSYYSTLVNSPAKVLGTDSINPHRNDPLVQSSSASQHPYVSVSQAADQSQPSSSNPLSAPPSSGSYDVQPIIPKLAFSEIPSNHPTTTSTPPNSSSNGTLRKLIKGSVSTPNLQQAASANVRLGTTRRIPKGIERWLSAETWCDALLFPRPRLRLHNETGLGRRTLSPPGSAVVPTGSGTAQATESIPSRVLAHSRSLVNLADSQRGAKTSSPLNVPQTRSHTFTERVEEAAASKPIQPPRPRSWSSDDLDLPTPVPSLARVLAEGERLDSERKEWQSQAAHSLGNKQARSVSRSRSKSLTANGRKANTLGKGNMNYLAARAVHGNQDVIPLVPSMRKQGKSPSQQGSMSRSSQSQTNTSSPGRSRTHSSRSHSHDHSRNDSWSKSALKVVHSAPCCDIDATKTPIIENTVPRHAEASRMPRNDILVHGVADPPFVINPSTTLPVPAIVPSPTPSNVSGITDPHVGIAISTPLPAEPLNRDHLRLPSHPYAQGGLYSAPDRPFNEQSAEYAGRHPVTSSTQPAEFPDDPAARHKLPPPAPLLHPYAQTSPSFDSYDDNLVNYVLADNSVLPASKTWGPSRSGAAREPLPREMKYSHYIDDDGNLTGVAHTAGVGEILAYAVEQQMEGESSAKDSRLRPAAGMQNMRNEADDSLGRLGPRSRVPVQYDVTRQVSPQHLQKSPDTPHTFASSSLEHRFTPKIPQFVKAEMKKNSTVPGAGPTESSQNLPVPEAGSGESSQRNSPRPLGSPNDLVGFQDLFYKPGGGSLRQRIIQKSSSRLSSPDSQSSLRQLSNIPFDLKSPNPRRASGLTTLARKLSEEYGQLSNKERTSSQHSLSSDSVAMGSPRSPLTQKPTEGSLEFVFEETRSADLSPDGQPITEQRLGLQSFRHQDNIPEDVASDFSTGTGKETEASEDETERIHVGNVEASTPAEVASDHRLSYTGQMDEVDISLPLSQGNTSQSVTFERFYHPGAFNPSSEGRIESGLQPPSTDITRSSFYTTASSMSNMSNLSDFPAPPRNHMSLLSAFFNEASGRSSADQADVEMSYPTQSNEYNRLTFGAGADAEDIVQALSNHPRPF